MKPHHPCVSLHKLSFRKIKDSYYAKSTVECPDAGYNKSHFKTNPVCHDVTMASLDPTADIAQLLIVTRQEFESSMACLHFILRNFDMHIRIKFSKGSVFSFEKEFRVNNANAIVDNCLSRFFFLFKLDVITKALPAQ